MMGSATMLAWVLFGGLAFGAQPSVHLTPAQIAAETAASRENSDFRYVSWSICLPGRFSIYIFLILSLLSSGD